MKRVSLLLLSLLVPSVFAAPLPEKADVLAVNTVRAVYEGVQDRPCRFLTSLCPDRCGHATRLALFKVVENEGYQKPGKYGDDKAEAGSIMYVDVLKDIEGQDASVARLIEGLKPGDEVRLTVTHYYVTNGQSMYPVRPATSIDRLDADCVELPRDKKN